MTRHATGLWIVIACGLAACHTSPQSSGSAARNPPPLGDLSRLDVSVQEQVRRDYAALQSAPSTAEGADAFGRVGKQLLAADYSEAAEPFFIRAADQSPQDMRWPYYLGHVYRHQQQLMQAATSFERAVTLAPNSVPALVWLGDTLVELGQSEEAERALKTAVELQPDSVAAWFRRGRAAAARGDQRRAIEYLERALALNPAADAVHYQLGLAYRDAGDRTRAEPHLRRRADAASIVPIDPLMEELTTLQGTAAGYVAQAVEALGRQDFPTAVDGFRKAGERSPSDGTIQLNLGTALYLQGDPRAARVALERSVQLAPRLPKAHYTLGLLEQAEGRDAAAIEQFKVATDLDPSYVDALSSLADALRRTGQNEQSLPHYARVLAIDPSASQAKFAYGMALVRLGRFRQARDWLAGATTAYPGQMGFPHALARLLAAAPEESVRDGQQALRLIEQLLTQQQNPALLETRAMAQAELGRYEDAVRSQRAALALAEAARQPLATLRDNLALYEMGRPCREPWRRDDAVFHPGPARD